jgi:nucleotide-binding universal stress UspA family protein
MSSDNDKCNCIDGSKESVNAVDYAIDVAKKYNAELIAVNVLTSDITTLSNSNKKKEKRWG